MWKWRTMQFVGCASASARHLMSLVVLETQLRWSALKGHMVAGCDIEGRLE